MVATSNLSILHIVFSLIYNHKSNAFVYKQSKPPHPKSMHLMNLITRKFGMGLSTHDLVVQFHVTTTCLFVRDFWNFYALENICIVKRLESDHLNICTVNNFPCVVKPAHLASPGSMLLSSSML